MEEQYYKSKIVIADSTGKNPNVMYEVGIAHTLGKSAVPIVQSVDDLPFDLRHHRALTNLPNSKGLEELKKNLVNKLRSISKQTLDDLVILP